MVETRELTIAQLKLSIIEAYINKGVRKVQLIDLTNGETITFNTIEDVTDLLINIGNIFLTIIIFTFKSFYNKFTLNSKIRFPVII